MFDSAITWFTPERRARIAFPLEMALGAWLALAILLNAQWEGGYVYNLVFIVFPALAVGAATAIHRVRPPLALLGLPIATLAVGFHTALSGRGVPGFYVFGAAIILFGAVAYGSSATAWVARACTALALVSAIVMSGGIRFAIEVGLSYQAIPTVEFVVLTSFALVPWVLGELVRSIRNRRQLSATVTAVSTQRDAALTRADVEAERTRVARDVHDIVAHSLTVVIAQADGARYATAGDSPAAADAFETIAQTARDALVDVRVLLTELRHTQEAGPQPGLADLDALLASMRDSGLQLELREFGDRGRLTDSRELALYRIVQESLTNALRHGEGAAVVEFEWGEQAVDMVVTNAVVTNAVVADTPESKERGHGIDGMRERASLAGGELSVHYGAVFRVRARLPLEPRPVEPDAPSADVPANTGAESGAESVGASA